MTRPSVFANSCLSVSKSGSYSLTKTGREAPYLQVWVGKTVNSSDSLDLSQAG